VADTQPPVQTDGAERDPLASQRYVFALEIAAKRLTRIDSATLEVAAFAAGLAPMDLAVIGSRETSVMLDANNLIEVLDHRQTPATRATFVTARALSHVVAAPDGLHALAYYDWDATDSAKRQREPGNINQITVLALEDQALPMADEDLRAQNVAVGFLPRDIRFASDGHRAVVIGRDSLTPVELLSMVDGIAAPGLVVPLPTEPAEVLLNPDATLAVLRFPMSPELTVLPLDGGPSRCLVAAAMVNDIAWGPNGSLLVVTAGVTAMLSEVDVAVAVPECGSVPAGVGIGSATRLVVDPQHTWALAYVPELTCETLWRVELANLSVTALLLEKAVQAAAFTGDGGYAFLSHMKAPGEPLWDPAQEDPDASVDKSYGISWLQLDTGAHRLAVSRTPFGQFTFVPAKADGSDGATFVAVLDPGSPQLLRVAHRPGFDDGAIALAAMPLVMGYLASTERVFVTQEHPWGRVTFVDPAGRELRHVTGYAMEVE